MWDVGKGFVMSTLRTHRDYVKALAYSVDKDIFASAGLDKKIYIWDVEALNCLTTINNTVTTAPCEGHKDSIYSLVINNAGTLLVSGGTEHFLRLWDPRTCSKESKLKGHTDNVKTLAISPDGTQLLSGSSDGTVKLWSIGQQRCVATFRNHNEGVWALATNSSFTKFYSGGREQTIYETDIKTSESFMVVREAGSILDIVVEEDTHLWVGTTQTSVNRWPLAAKRSSHIDNLTVPKPSRTIPGAQGLKKVHVLNDKQHVICTDTEGNATLFDVLHACKVEDLGKVDIKAELEKRNRPEYVPNWFTADVKTGMLSIHLDEGDCYSAWVVHHEDVNGDNDNKINYGGLIIQALLEYWNCTNEEKTVSEEDKLCRIPFNKHVTVPTHTPLSFIEGTDGCGKTLFRVLVSEAGEEMNSRILDDLVPSWVYNTRVKNETPKFTKIAFFVEPFAEDPPPKSREGRLSANDFLAVSKVIEYVDDKILGSQDNSSNIPRDIAIYCNKQRLETTMDLRTVKHTIWKSGSDLRLMYIIHSNWNV